MYEPVQNISVYLKTVSWVTYHYNQMQIRQTGCRPPLARADTETGSVRSRGSVRSPPLSQSRISATKSEFIHCKDLWICF